MYKRNPYTTFSESRVWKVWKSEASVGLAGSLLTQDCLHTGDKTNSPLSRPGTVMRWPFPPSNLPCKEKQQELSTSAHHCMGLPTSWSMYIASPYVFLQVGLEAKDEGYCCSKMTSIPTSAWWVSSDAFSKEWLCFSDALSSKGKRLGNLSPPCLAHYAYKKTCVCMCLSVHVCRFQNVMCSRAQGLLRRLAGRIGCS